MSNIDRLNKQNESQALEVLNKQVVWVFTLRIKDLSCHLKNHYQDHSNEYCD